MQYLPNIIVNIFVPICAGLIFLALARYVRHIAPIRHFSAGKATYDAAYFGFIAFGIYLATRPLQILLGPHPMPLIINNIREFFMIGIFGPSVLLAIYGLAFGGESVKKIYKIVFYGIGFICATVFVIVNVKAIGGSEPIFYIGSYPAYDGMWFKDVSAERSFLMKILFICRLISPVILLVIGATIALVRAVTYPLDRKQLYSNMPKKLILSSIGTYCFSLSMLCVGFIWIFVRVPNQWWGYYVGAFLAGFFEAWSISLPLRKEEDL
ncbi:MAG: hypothetical protein A2252_01300 [Elusimicrobia bacterium RIFOXYA2_FULL_39_19]|nr:MAG: hypothetical protein A2252_01300 [Elusimicrobia bacterium RIFOXYA2_FULL_39_19]